MSQGNKRKVNAPAEPPSAPHRSVPWYRQCPLCWGGQHGVGEAYNTTRVTDTLAIRYYKCDKCEHTWSAKIKSEVVSIEHRTVELNER